MKCETLLPVPELFTTTTTTTNNIFSHSQVKASGETTACWGAGCSHAVTRLCHHCAWIWLLTFCFQLIHFKLCFHLREGRAVCVCVCVCVCARVRACIVLIFGTCTKVRIMWNRPLGLYFIYSRIIYSSGNLECLILNWDQSKIVTEHQSAGCLNGKMVMGLSVPLMLWPRASQVSYQYQCVLIVGEKYIMCTEVAVDCGV